MYNYNCQDKILFQKTFITTILNTLASNNVKVKTKDNIKHTKIVKAASSSFASLALCITQIYLKSDPIFHL